ncbi:MAG: hypothetical protein HY720_08025 [Planctomycetes bacterium]|nr:hypothetical protein [Planctomycetota bacterium]
MLRGWMISCCLAGAFAAGCVHTGKNTYDHSDSTYVIEDRRSHVDEGDYYYGGYYGEHRYREHRWTVEKEGYYHAPYNPDNRYDFRQ